MAKYRRGLTMLLAILLLFIMPLSEACLIYCADHECSGAGCSVCAAIFFCENLLKSLGLAFAAAIVSAILFCIHVLLSHITYGQIRRVTPVSLKVKLSN